MNGKYRVLILFMFCLLRTTSGECLSEDIIGPYCRCYGDSTLMCTQPEDQPPWDIKGHFQKINEVVPSDVVLGSLRIEGTHLKEIPAGATHNLKFNNISITNNDELEFIHPDAFDGSASTTTELTLSNNPLITDEEPHNIFHFITKFKNLEKLGLMSSYFNSFSAEFFDKIPNLVEIYAPSIKLKGLGPRTFAGLPKLNLLYFIASSLSLEGIDEHAFDGINKGVHIELGASHIKALPKSIFQPLLDAAKAVNIPDQGQGCVNVGGSPRCSDRGIECGIDSDWICQDVNKYRRVLHYAGCTSGSGFTNIFNYCDKTSGKN